MVAITGSRAGPACVEGSNNVAVICKTLNLTFQTVALDYDLPDSIGATLKSAQEETWGASRQTI